MAGDSRPDCCAGSSMATGTGRRGPQASSVSFSSSLGGAVAILGPYVAPYSPTALVGLPLDSPSREHLLGTDQLGRDVLSRVLNGGRSVLILATLAVIVTFVVGGPAGDACGLSRREPGRRAEPGCRRHDVDPAANPGADLHLRRWLVQSLDCPAHRSCHRAARLPHHPRRHPVRLGAGFHPGGAGAR